MIPRDRARLEKDLQGAIDTLNHWIEKPTEFWTQWQGRSKTDIVSSWEEEVKSRGFRLDLFIKNGYDRYVYNRYP